MREIEILVKVLESEKSARRKIANKARFVGDKKVEDIYYFDPLRKKRYDELESFRLRRKDGRVYLTHKHDHYVRKGVWLYSDELETSVGDFTVTKKLIEALGMKELIHLSILKHTYEASRYEIALERVKGLGLFLEVEALRVNNKEKIGTVKKAIWDFIKGLGVKTSKELMEGKMTLALKAHKHRRRT